MSEKGRSNQDYYIDFRKNMNIMFNAMNPGRVHGQTNLKTQDIKRWLYNKIYSCFDFDFEDLKWDKNTFRWSLFHFGSLALSYNDEFGWIFSAWSPTKYNIYYNPTEWKIIPFNKNVREIKTGIATSDNSVIVKCFDDYFGFDDLVSDTAEMLAACDKAVNVALMNGNINLLGFAKTKKEALEIKTAYAAATTGEPLVMLNDDLIENRDQLLQPFTNHDTIISLDRILTSRRTILNNFLTEVGIKNANFQKKERLITDEVNSNDEEVSANVTIAYDNIKAAFKKFNEMSGLNISIDLNYDYLESQNNITVNETVETGGSDV